MAASPSSPAKFVFEPNVPQLIALKWTKGKEVHSQYSEQPQVMFSLVDGRTLYVSQSVATSIANLQLGNREPFNICMRWNGEKNQQRRYDVWLTPQGEKDRAAMEMAATPLEEALEASLDKREEDIKAQLTAQLAAIQQRKTAQAAQPHGVMCPCATCLVRRADQVQTAKAPQGPVAVPARTVERPKTKLEDALKTVVAAIFAAQEYAKEIGYAAMPQFSAEDIRTMANTLIIDGQRNNGGGR